VVVSVTAPPVTVRGVQLNRGEAMTAVLGLAGRGVHGRRLRRAHGPAAGAHRRPLDPAGRGVSARQTMLRGILRGAGALLLGVLAFLAQFSRTWPRPQGTARRS